MFNSYNSFEELRKKLAVISAADQELFLNEIPRKDYEDFVIFCNRFYNGSFSGYVDK